MIYKKTYFILAIGLCTVAGQASSSHVNVEVANIDNLKNNITIEVYESLTPDNSAMGSCWKNSGERHHKETISYDHYILEPIIGPKNAIASEKICIESSVVGQRFFTNPLNNVLDCEIQFYSTVGDHENSGIARASKACGYTGRCVDGKPYNYNQRADNETDGFVKNCLPYKIFK
jgi:hypothetical protein